MKNDLISQIKDLIPSLSKGQRAIGNYIIENYDKAAFMTAAKLGEHVGVSESTVVRFAVALNYDGYPELQKSLQELIRNKLTSVQRIEIANDRIGDSDILERVLNLDIMKIRTTLDGIDREHFYRAVDAIIRAKHIYIIGVRSSASLANFMSFYFRLIFENVSLVQTASGSEMFEQLLHVSSEDEVIAISFPRYSKSIINAVDYASSKNATVVSLTDSPLSPIADKASCLLTAKSDMLSFVDSLVAPLSIINALIVAVAKEKRSEIEDIFRKLESVWDEYDVYDKESGR
ncbi:MAG: MurR/RpiR family transcriptional regulator [Ruminococcaceae bacterium]|nr:MurR/RpiR family transcriptional regulator [Oscillospiraceae bacterium]